MAETATSSSVIVALLPWREYVELYSACMLSGMHRLAQWLECLCICCLMRSRSKEHVNHAPFHIESLDSDCPGQDLPSFDLTPIRYLDTIALSCGILGTNIARNSKDVSRSEARGWLAGLGTCVELSWDVGVGERDSVFPMLFN